MSENKLAFLESGYEPPEMPPAETPAEQPAETTTASEQHAEAVSGAVEAPQEPETAQRDEKGRFAPKAATEAAVPVEPGHVPLSAVLDERERRQAAEKAKADLEAELLRVREQRMPQELEPEQAQALASYQQNMRFSRKFAEREYGKDVIAEVHDWAIQRCDTDPIFNQQIFTSEDPYETAYQAFNREKILAEVNADELAAFKAWKAAQADAQAPATQIPQQPNTPPPPRSLASASNAGGPGAATDTIIGPGQAFAGLFSR